MYKSMSKSQPYQKTAKALLTNLYDTCGDMELELFFQV